MPESDHFLLGHAVVHKCLPKRVPRLTTSSLPQEDPQHLKQLAEKLFNASVATSTARKYDIATRHVAKLEAELGRELPFPLSPDPPITGLEWPLHRHDQVLPGRDKKVGNGKRGGKPTSIRTGQIHPEPQAEGIQKHTT